MAVFRRAIAANPHAVGPHINLGRALFRLDQLDEAIVELREATRIAPDVFEGHANLGNVYLGKGMVSEAIASYRKAAGIQPKNAAIHFNLGLAFAKAGSFKEAIDGYRRALGLEPDDAAARCQLAIALNNSAWRLAARRETTRADASRAVAIAQEAVGLFPQDGHFRNTLGVVHYRAGNWKDAVAALTKALETKGGGGSGWFFLAMAHWQLGNKHEAYKWYQRAVEWMDNARQSHEELRTFREEAKVLLQLKG
jgi:tetratricopeptide (TPR) repeat protein